MAGAFNRQDARASPPNGVPCRKRFAITRKAILAAIPVLALAACAPVKTDENFVSDAPAAQVVGEAESCITVSQLRNTVVHDDRTIDFHVGSRIYRNTLRSTCPRLGFEEAITYDVRGAQLCRPDIIYVLETFGGELRRGVGCQLGDFVPVELIEDDQ